MLEGKLVLFEIQDTEAFCGRILQRSGLELSYHDREDALAFLVETAWELSLVYQPGVIRKGFSTWLGIALRQRIVDWQRRDGGRTRWQFADRTYERTLPSFIPLDDRPDEPDHGRDLDAAAGGLSDLLGLQRAGDRGHPERSDPCREAPPRSAA